MVIPIVKEREISLELEQLSCLLKRLPEHHLLAEEIKKDRRIIRSSLKGEREVAYSLKFLNEDDFLILHNLRIGDENGYFQIDFLLLHKNFMLILEVKNWYGTVFFGENNQVTRVGDDGIEEGFPNPIPQVKLQRFRLKKWLHAYGLSNIPVDYYVVISFPSTIIKAVDANHPTPEKVIHNSDLFFRIQSLEEMYQVPFATMNQLKQLAASLIRAHTPPVKNILNKYHIAKNELIKGVVCPQCSAIPMIRRKQSWYCQKCKCFSANAHFQALNDYKLLIDNYISNQEAREFLMIDSPYVAKRILQAGKYDYTGTTKNRVYKVDFR